MKEEQRFELYQDIIDKLINKKSLSDSENNIVENDVEFQAYKNEFGFISEAIKKSALHKKLDTIKELENNFVSASANKKKSKNKRTWLIAIVILFLLGAVYLFMQLNKGGNYDKDLLVASNMPHYPESDGTRGTDEQQKNLAYELYKKREYRPAINEFKKLIDSDKNPKHKFHYAVSLLSIEKYKEAQSLLEDLSSQGYKDVPVNFYLAMSKIGTDEPVEAIELLSNPTLESPILDEKREKFIRILSR